MSARSRPSFSGGSGIFLCGRSLRKTATTSVQLKGEANAKMRSFCIAGASKAIACSRAVSCTSTYHSGSTILVLFCFPVWRATHEAAFAWLHHLPPKAFVPSPCWTLESPEQESFRAIIPSVSTVRQAQKQGVVTSQFGKTVLKTKPGRFSFTHSQAARSPSVLDAA